MRFDRGFFGLPFFIFPPFNPEFRRDRDDFIFDERFRRRDENHRHRDHDNRGFDNRR
jgi:hypothetical protein